MGEGLMISDKDLRWNRFIENICRRNLSTLSPIQRRAVLCFRYDAEMNSGGYSGYADCYPETDPDELEEAIMTVGYKEIADNYRKAVTDGVKDDWGETDEAYYKFSPSLSECLGQYVEDNKSAVFD